MDVLFLTQTYPRTPEDTSGPFIRELARALVRGGDRVRVLAPHAAGLRAQWLDDGVEVATFRYAPEPLELLGYSRSLAADEVVKGPAMLVTPLYALAARRAVGRALAQRRADVVQAHWVVPNAPLVRFAARRRPPLAVGGGIHGSDVFLAERPLVRTVTRRALADCSFLTGCSPELVDRVCAVGFPRERARVIPYGVDAAVFRPDAARRAIWRQRLGIAAEAPLLLGVGRMATKKGFQVLLRELPALLAELPDAHVVLAGAGDLLAGFQASMAGERRVHFPGAVLRDTLPDLFRAADVFTLPAVHDRRGNVDGLPNVVLEAMASGLPVVATEISGIPLAVRTGVEGVLVAEGDGPTLRAAIVGLLRDRDRAQAMGAAARRRAEAELGWDRVAGLYRDAYRDGVARGAIGAEAALAASGARA